MNYYLLALSIIVLVAGVILHFKHRKHEDEDVRMIGSTMFLLGGTTLLWSIFGVVVALGALVLFFILTVRIRSYH